MQVDEAGVAAASNQYQGGTAPVAAAAARATRRCYGKTFTAASHRSLPQLRHQFSHLPTLSV